jgi:uncharacterized Zn finger protein (UPF0148 family)
VAKVPINPVTVACPKCGELIHVERIMEAAAKDEAAKKELSKTSYAKDRERRLQRVLERLKGKRRRGRT